MKTLSRQRLRLSERQQPSFVLKLNTSLPLIPSLIIICWTARTCAAQGTAIPLSEADIQEIVEAHNLFRRSVEPPASNMQRIVWNPELATIAQRYSETCMFGPNPNRANEAPNFDTVGENRAFGRTTNYTDLIERGWFVQRSNFNFSRNMCLSPGACDEYTQLVWAESNMVGCGVANCPEVTGLPILPNVNVFVCNYAPEGNIQGQQPYLAGDACTQCPEGMESCVLNSCSISTAPPTTTETILPPTTPSTAATTSPTEATTELPTTAVTTVAPPTTSGQSPPTTPPCPPVIPSGPSTAVTPKPTTVIPTKNPLTSWYLLWLIIKNKQKPYIIVPTRKPERTRNRSKSRSGTSRKHRRGHTKKKTSGRTSKSKSSHRRRSRKHRRRGKGSRKRG